MEKKEAATIIEKLAKYNKIQAVEAQMGNGVNRVTEALELASKELRKEKS